MMQSTGGTEFTQGKLFYSAHTVDIISSRQFSTVEDVATGATFLGK